MVGAIVIGTAAVEAIVSVSLTIVDRCSNTKSWDSDIFCARFWTTALSSKMDCELRDE